jgi:hypothetical protein
MVLPLISLCFGLVKAAAIDILFRRRYSVQGDRPISLAQ